MKRWLIALLCGAVLEGILAFCLLGVDYGYGTDTLPGFVAVRAHAFPGLPLWHVLHNHGVQEPLASAGACVAQWVAWVLLFRTWLSRRQALAHVIGFFRWNEPRAESPVAAGATPPAGPGFERRVVFISLVLLAAAATGYWYGFIRLPDPPVLADTPGWRPAPLKERHTLVKLLWTRQFAELDRMFDQGADRYWHQQMPAQSWGSWFWYLEHANASVEPAFDDWVEHSPKSGWARLTRGLFLAQRGGDERGSDLARSTKPEQFKRMNAYLDRARVDLELADQRIERCALCMSGLIKIKMYKGEPGARELIERAMNEDINQWAPEDQYMNALYPQWGGSEAQMLDFVAETRRRNPDLGKRMEATFHFRRGLDAVNDTMNRSAAEELSVMARVYNLSRNRTAAEEYGEAVRIYPLPFALENLADLYMKDYDYDAAIPLLEKNLAANDDWDLYTIELLTQAYWAADRAAEGDAMYEKRDRLLARYKKGE